MNESYIIGAINELNTNLSITVAQAAHAVTQWSSPCLIEDKSADGFLQINTDRSIALNVSYQNLQNAVISSGFSYICA